ncbi:hypothetical protein [Demequina sp.]|uniref:hypothetical protein n=1 Tax=Demequina sp. TaxID=2050685 RepID=UPI003D147330
MSPLTYQDPARLELVRAVSLGGTVATGCGLALVIGQIVAWERPGLALLWPVFFLAGLGTLLWSRAQLNELFARNKPYLLSEHGAEVLRARREHEARSLWVGRAVLAVFLVCGIVFIALLSAINCGDRVDGYCGDVGRPPEPLVILAQFVALGLGGLWAAIISSRRRHESETERIDAVVAEGHRRRRNDDPMAGTNRFAWE